MKAKQRQISDTGDRRGLILPDVSSSLCFGNREQTGVLCGATAGQSMLRSLQTQGLLLLLLLPLHSQLCLIWMLSFE